MSRLSTPEDAALEAVFERGDPPVSCAQAEALAADIFGVSGRASPLPGERDLNLRVDADDARYLLKISPSAEPARVTDLQTQILLHVAARERTFPVPRLTPDRAGAPQHLWASPEGPRRTVRLLSWLPGRPLRQVEAGPAVLERIGAILARLDAVLEDFAHPADGHELLWDLQRAAALERRLGSISDPELRALAAQGLRGLVELGPGRSEVGRGQVIHNDLNSDNVLVGPAGQVSGVIDFGDAVRAPRIQELAVAAAYHVRSEGEPLTDVIALARGYDRIAGLGEAEVERLPALIAGRLAARLVISAWQAELHPETGDELVRNAAPAALGLRRLVDLGDGRAVERLWSGLGRRAR